MRNTRIMLAIAAAIAITAALLVGSLSDTTEAKKRKKPEVSFEFTTTFIGEVDTTRQIATEILFIDTSVYRPGLEPCHREALAPEGEKIVMHISNFRAVKRAEDVVSVFAKLTAKQPSRLVLVGDGPERPRASRSPSIGLIRYPSAFLSNRMDSPS